METTLKQRVLDRGYVQSANEFEDLKRSNAQYDPEVKKAMKEFVKGMNRKYGKGGHHWTM